MTIHHTGRWWFAGLVVLLAAALGAVTARPLPLLVAVVGVTYATYARTFGAPTVDVALERSLSDPAPNPDDLVEVTVTVRNDGDALADVRLVDGVPTALEVAEGSPRHAAALRSGGETTFSYAVRARRGQHGFDPATVLARDPPGSVERETTADVETVLTCLPPLSEVPLRSQTTQLAGRIATDSGGEGLQFHSTRRYRPGDDISRIDWNRRARTGELSTVEFREEKAAGVMVVVDARPAAYWAPAEGERTAVEHSVGAAGRVFSELLDGGDQVGIAALGPKTCWLGPGAGNEHEHRARTLLATHPALSAVPPGDGPPELAIDPDHEPVDLGWLRARLDPDVQVILLSPVCDDGIAAAVRTLQATGNDVTVISPDVTSRDSPGRRVAALQRANRLHRIREAGVRVVEWDVAEPFANALARAEVAP